MSNSDTAITKTAVSKNLSISGVFNSQVFIAFSSTSLVAESYLLCGLPINLRVIGLIFFSTLMIYNLAHLRIDLHKFIPDNTSSKSVHGVLVKISLIAILPFLISAGWMELLIFFLLGFASLAYVMPFVQNDSKVKGLRNVPLLKNIFLAFIWAAATVALPLTAVHDSLINSHVILVFVQRFFFIFTLSFLFDIRDIQYDHSAGVITLAGVTGIKHIRVFAVLSLSAFISVTLFDQIVNSNVLLYWPAFAISALYTFILIIMSKPDRPQWFYAGFVDSATIIQLALLILLMQYHG